MKQAIIGGFLFIGGIVLLIGFNDHRNMHSLALVGLILGLLGLGILLIELFSGNKPIEK